jgi:hypothetical protein
LRVLLGAAAKLSSFASFATFAGHSLWILLILIWLVSDAMWNLSWI